MDFSNVRSPVSGSGMSSRRVVNDMKKEFIDTLNPSKLSDFKEALHKLQDYLDGHDAEMDKIRHLREGLKQGTAPTMMDIEQLYEVVDKTLNQMHKIKISTTAKESHEEMKFYEWCQLQHD